MPFTLNSNLSATAFVLAKNDPVGWSLAAQLAANLGQTANIQIADLTVAYADAVPDEIRSTRDLLLIGKPSALALVGELGKALPALFAPGSNVASEDVLRVSYHIPPDASIGYLQMLASPWNVDRTIVGVFGTNDEGLNWATRALLTPRLRNTLAGDFALLNDQQVTLRSVDAGTAAAPLVPPTASVANITEEAMPERPAWMIPAIMFSLAIMVSVVLIVGVSMIRQRRTKRSQLSL